MKPNKLPDGVSETPRTVAEHYAQYDIGSVSLREYRELESRLRASEAEVRRLTQPVGEEGQENLAEKIRNAALVIIDGYDADQAVNYYDALVGLYRETRALRPRPEGSEAVMKVWYSDAHGYDATADSPGAKQYEVHELGTEARLAALSGRATTETGGGE